VSALAIAGLAICFTVGRLGFVTSESALIKSDNRLMQRLKLADRFSELDGFIVAIENRDTQRSLAFVRDLAGRLEAEQGLFAQVFSRIDLSDCRPWALLYLTPKELDDLYDNLDRHQQFLQNLARSPGLATFFEGVNSEMTSSMVGHLFTGFLEPSKEGGEGEPMDLQFLIDALRGMKAHVEGSPLFVSPWRSFFSKGSWKSEDEEGYLWTGGKKFLLVFVTPKASAQGAPGQIDALSALRRIVAAERERFPDVEAGVTGQKALDEDEKHLALTDMSLATVLSLAGLAVLLLLFWRTVRRPLLQLTTQVVGLSVTFGLTTLLIGHLNLLSVTFAPMVLGLGMDYDIHWFSRYNEERRRPGQSTENALGATMEKVGPAIALAALSTCLAFFPLALTRFKGLAELGLICTIGLFVASATTLCLLPALIMLFDAPFRRTHFGEGEQEVGPLVPITKGRALILVSLAVVAAGLSSWGAGKVRFDLDMLHLQSKNAESVLWETKLIKGSKHPSIYGVLFAHSLAEVAAKTRAAKKLPTVSEVQSVESFLPEDQDLKRSILGRMKPLLAGAPAAFDTSGPVDVRRVESAFTRIRFKMEETEAGAWGATRPLEAQMREVRFLIDGIERGFGSQEKGVLLGRLKQFQAAMMGDLNDKLSLLRENMDGRPLQVSDLPRPLRERFVGANSLFPIRVFPASDIWDPHFLGAFVRDLRSVDPDATGDPVTLSVFTKQFRDSSIRAALYALICIFAFLVLAFRSVPLALSAISPLVVGALWTFGLMHLFGVDLNLANTIFLPLVVGAGVEYGVIIVQRWRQRTAGSRQGPLPVSTGLGVLLAGFSTTVGFASLMISRHQGIHSLGLLTTLGSLAVLAAAVLVLPALLYLLSGERNDRDERERPGTEETELSMKMGEVRP